MNNIIDLLDATVAGYPDKAAVICEGEELTYAALDGLVRRLSGHLRGQWGIGPGDRVALLMPNCAETVVAYLAVIRTGAIALPVNTRLTPSEIEFIVNDAGARALVAHGKFGDTVAEVVPQLPQVEKVLAIGFEMSGATPYAGMVAAPAPDFDVPDMQPDDVAAIIYTSGTTGLPKGAMLMHKNLIFNAHSTIHGFGFAHDERHLVVVPLYHVTGLNTILVTSLMIGSTIVVSDRTAPRDIIAAIERYRTDTFFGVPTTYVFFLETEGIAAADLSSARIFVYSGAPMPPETILRLRALFPGVDLVNLYGLTETTSVTTVLPAADALDKIESVGKAVPNLELKVLDAGDREVRPGGVGGLCVKGDSVFKGYYNRPEANAEAFVDGWFRTGDDALIDDDGYVFLKGRNKELIIVGGENVYPIEVENIICALPQVLEAAVIGADDPVMGEAVEAVVVLERGAKLGEAEIIRHCTERLASFKVPRSVAFIGHLPRNPSGKVVKRMLRRQLAAGPAIRFP